VCEGVSRLVSSGQAERTARSTDQCIVLDSGFLEGDDVRLLTRTQEPPVQVCKLLSACLRHAKEQHGGEAPNDRERLYLEGLIGQLVDLAGNCGRIVKVPVPLAYSRHTSRFLSLFTITLPYALVANCGFWVVPVVSGISWAFYSIESIGQYIENPFDVHASQIALNPLCQSITRDVAQILSPPSGSPFISTEAPVAARVNERETFSKLSAEDEDMEDRTPGLP